MVNILRFISWPIIAGLLAGLLLLQWWPDQQDAPAPSQHAQLTTLAPAANAAAPAVVNIYTRKIARRHPLLDDPFFRRFLRDRQERVQRSLGSGVILRSDGYIVTNHHVIRGADEILVLLADGRNQLATVVGSDPESDLAVLKIELPELPSMQFSKPQSATVGDIVLAIGNPFGFGQTVTQGIISAKGRYGLNLNTFEDYIQTDAAINPGNSGGALVDVQGRLLGINTAIYSKTGASNGIGLAIPVSTVMKVVDDIIEHGRPLRGWLGIEVLEWTEQLAYSLNLSGPPRGVVITNTARSGPADRAGLQRGDIILEISKEMILDAHQAMNLITNEKPGSKVTIKIDRYGHEQEITVEIGLRSS
jgi:serine protease DegS